jgi:hypothetical protein
VGELAGVGEQVAQDLLQALLVGDDGGRQRLVAGDEEIEAVLLGHGAEGALDVVAEVDERDGAAVELHLAGLDLGEVEDVVDEGQKVVAGGVDRLGELDLLRLEVALAVVGEHAREDEQRVERRAQLVAHVGQELGLVLRGQRELGGLLLQPGPSQLDLRVLDLDVAVLLLEDERLVLQLVIGLAQLLGLLLELLGQGLGLDQQLLGAHVGLDRVDHDPDRVGELVEEGLVDLGEGP